jgi:hypothetical protein
MDGLLYTYAEPVGDGNGNYYTAQVHGDTDAEGRWVAWLVFVPEDGRGPTRRTGIETTQATRDALVFWATGLETTYLEGALGRMHATS